MIEVGEYVRNKQGYIGKIYKKFPSGMEIAIDYRASHIFNDIVKHSKNIIDLIEVGDYVNGMLVIEVINITQDDKTYKVVLVNRDKKCILQPLRIYEKTIKSIVTKEKFASMEYRLED